MVKLRSLLVPSCLALLACGQETHALTQLVLVADTDITALDSVEFVISSATDGSRSARASRLGASEPSFLSVVHEQGSLGPLTVSARGLRAGGLVVERTQRVSFVPDQTRVVPLHLFASCVGVVCAAGLTCSAQGCVPQALDASELPMWTGEPPRAAPSDAPDAGESTLDGGAEAHDSGREAGLDAQLPSDAQAARDADASDAAPSVIRDAATDAGDAATAKLTQCGDAGLFDLQTDSAHCGKCSKLCKTSTESCMAGTCIQK